MGVRRDSCLTVGIIVIALITSRVGAQEIEGFPASAATRQGCAQVSGIVLDRLSRQQLKAWKSITEVVLATDRGGRPMYPLLYDLYRRVDSSGHVIQMEISTQRATLCAAGLCRIEFHPERPQPEVILIRLNLGMIDRAIASEISRRKDGFVPLAGLSRRERYAEVLGHELAHVAELLTNSDYRNIYLERQALADNRSQDVRVVQQLTSLIEGPAEAAEVMVWRELRAGQRHKH
jgi:hypothetical protein